jgi:LPS sulfotransferase NodH
MTPAAFVICATPRSGSTLLCDLLSGTGIAGRPDSFYRRESIAHFCRQWRLAPGSGPEFERRYLDAVVREGTGDTGMFGMRVMWPSLPELVNRLTALFPERTTARERIAAAFGPPLYIHLRRHDRIAQAVSRSKAEQSGLWHRAADGSVREQVGPAVAARYDADAIARFIAESEEHEAAWHDWFAAERIAPVEMVYEELAADPPAVLARVLDALGRDPALASRAHVQTARLADTESRQWTARFAAEHDVRR